jgi:excisionase family DNA binding protein
MVLTMSTTEAEELARAATEIEATLPSAANWLRRQIGAFGSSSQDEYMSTTEVADVLGVTPQTIRNWVDRGWIECRRIGLRRQVPRSALSGVYDFRTSRRVASMSGIQVDEAEVAQIVRDNRSRRRAATSRR